MDGIMNKKFDYREVAAIFLTTYYKVLSKNPIDAGKFYKPDDSFGMSDGTLLQGPTKIQERILSLGFQNALFDLAACDFQPSGERCILILVTGSVTKANTSTPVKFMQSFLLEQDAKNLTRFVVANDILRFLNDKPAVGAQGGVVMAANVGNVESTTTSVEKMEQEKPSPAPIAIVGPAATGSSATTASGGGGGGGGVRNSPGSKSSLTKQAAAQGSKGNGEEKKEEAAKSNAAVVTTPSPATENKKNSDQGERKPEVKTSWANIAAATTTPQPALNTSNNQQQQQQQAKSNEINNNNKASSNAAAAVGTINHNKDNSHNNSNNNKSQVKISNLVLIKNFNASVTLDALKPLFSPFDPNFKLDVEKKCVSFATSELAQQVLSEQRSKKFKIGTLALELSYVGLMDKQEGNSNSREKSGGGGRNRERSSSGRGGGGSKQAGDAKPVANGAVAQASEKKKAT